MALAGPSMALAGPSMALAGPSMALAGPGLPRWHVLRVARRPAAVVAQHLSSSALHRVFPTRNDDGASRGMQRYGRCLGGRGRGPIRKFWRGWPGARNALWKKRFAAAAS